MVAEPGRTLPAALTRAVGDRRLAVLAGAGLSVLAPSSLPSWRDFTNALLEEAKASARAATFLDDGCRHAIDSLTPEIVGDSTLSEAIAKYVAGVGYFPMVTVLDGTETNANHRALAELVGREALRAIVTPNFDTLIERACRDAGVPLHLPGYEPKESTGSPNGPCVLVHIHGTATHARSIVDTVAQKVRGLSWVMHERLRAVFREYHLLVVGFSGTDLDFGTDYLSLEDGGDEGPGITWVTRSGVPPAARISALIHRKGLCSSIVEATLPDFWRELGCDVAAEAPRAVEADLEAARMGARSYVRSVFAYLGPPLGAALCMRLLDDAGLRTKARLLYRALASYMSSRAEAYSPLDWTVLRALSSSDGFSSMEEKLAWLSRDVEVGLRGLHNWKKESRKVRSILRSSSGERLKDVQLSYPFEGTLDSEGWQRAEQVIYHNIHFLLAIGFGNLATTRAIIRDFDGAKTARGHAVDYALLAADLRALTACYWVDGVMAYMFDAPLSPTLWWLLIAEGAGLASGDIDAACHAALQRAHLLTQAGEYDLAAEVLERVAARAMLGGKAILKGQASLLLANLMHRRHQYVEALDLWEEAMSLARETPVLGAQVRWNRIMAMEHEPAMRSDLLNDCDLLLEAMEAGALVPEAPLFGVPNAEVVRRRRSEIDRAGEFRLPWFVVLDSRVANYAGSALPSLRQVLVNSEYLRDPARALEALGAVANGLLEDAGDYSRASEVGRAYLDAANASGDIGHRFRARWILSHARYALGDLDGAREAAEGLATIERLNDAEQNARKRAWLSRLASSPPLVPHPYLLVRDLAEGRPALRLPSAELERLARQLLGDGFANIAQVVLCHLAQEYREREDRAGLARCYELLADSAKAVGRRSLARELRGIVRSLSRGQPEKGVREALASVQRAIAESLWWKVTSRR